MSGINCFEARLYGIQFEFFNGVRIDKVANGKIQINGLVARPYIGAKQITKGMDVEEVFAGEEDVWVGEIKGEYFLFQAGITKDSNHIVPISQDPEFSGTRYVQLLCEKEDEVTVLGDGRVIFRLLADNYQSILLEMRKEAVVTVEHADGATAILEYTGTVFKTA